MFVADLATDADHRRDGSRVARGTSTLLTFWPPDRKYIVYASIRGSGLRVVESNGSGRQTIVVRRSSNTLLTYAVTSDESVS